MGHAAGQASDRLHLLRLAELLLESSPGGHVGREHEPRRPAVVLDRMAADLDLDDRAVAAEVAEDLRARVAVRQARQAGPEPGQVVRMDELSDGQPDELAAVVAVLARRRA